jgi:D-glycero-D-manno-heptose 1,7-bisphosphate phosphatase
MGKHEVTRRAVFLDRDGVLNRVIVREDRPHPPASVEEFELYEDALAGCERLKNAGFLLVVASNQPDVGRGTQSRLIAEAINNKLLQLIPVLDRIEVCFHAGEDHGQNCNCRKPKPGMLFHAAELMNIDLANSYMIGDRWRDVDCAKAAGCRAIFIDRGYTEALHHLPDLTVRSFAEAVAAVVSTARLPQPN